MYIYFLFHRYEPLIILFHIKRNRGIKKNTDKMNLVEKVYCALVRESGLIVSEDAAHYLVATMEFLIKEILSGGVKISNSQNRNKILPSDLTQYLSNDVELRAALLKKIS